MQPAGLAEVERAKADGRWDAAYDPPRRIRCRTTCRPSSTPARRGGVLRTLNSTNRYAILYRLHDAKKPETRARRLAKFVAMLERGETLH